jgi:hypothetical protein
MSVFTAVKCIYCTQRNHHGRLNEQFFSGKQSGGNGDEKGLNDISAFHDTENRQDRVDLL